MDSKEHQSSDSISHSTLKTLPLHSTDLLTLLDDQGVINYESPAIERLYGYDQEELVGEEVAEYFHPEDRKRVMKAFETVVTAKDTHSEAVEYRHLMADGSYRWIESVASSNPTPDGHYVINSRDISERKQHEQELRTAKQQAQSERDGKEAVRELLIEASSVGVIGEGVCRLLVEEYGYEAAWIVTQTEASNDHPNLMWLADHGTDRGFRAAADKSGWCVDAATRRCLDSDAPVTVTVDTDGSDSSDGSDETNDDIGNDTSDGNGDSDTGDEVAVVDRLRACELASVRSVPLAYDGVSYGALTVVRSDTDGGFAAELVEEVAIALGFKWQVDRQQAALRAETVTELELRIPDDHLLAALSAAPSLPAEASFVVEELRAAEGESASYLVKTAAIDGATLVAAASELAEVRGASIVTETDERAVVQLRVAEPTVGSVVSGYSGILQSMTAADGRVDVTVQFPRRTDVSRVVETVTNHWPAATLQARGKRGVDTERPGLLEGLTRKQEDALRAATLSGFFDRPQEASASEVAETMGVSSSTFLHHLRTGERKVFGDAFGDGEE